MLSTKIIFPFGGTFLDYPDNHSYAAIVYFMGCENQCMNCHNIEFKNKDNNKSIEILFNKFYDELFLFCKKNNTNKVVFSGGDPLSPYSRDFVRAFLTKYNNIFDVCIYTGYTIEQVRMLNIKGFKYIKVGPYDETQQQESCQSDNFFQLASKNQEIYNENYSLLTRNGVLNFK